MKLSYSACSVEGQFVAMTFDDGPHPQNTPRLLDMLKQRGTKATFFVVGQNAAEHPEILKRIVAEGHELANHSYTHPVLASKSEAALREELDKTHQAVLKSTGFSMKVMRPPYGALSEPQRRWTHANFGYRIILWDVDPLDWKYRDAARVQSEILGHTKAGSIILSHDIHKSTVDAMPETLDALASKGFKFVTVSELLAMDKPATPKAPSPNAKPVAKADAKSDSKRPALEAKSKAKAADKEVSTKTDAPATKSKAAPKQVAMTQEEIRKKWLEINNQR
jgi:peptidoglycan/xylan/chitin deacetylase (PgdA/CDA1 family)